MHQKVFCFHSVAMVLAFGMLLVPPPFAKGEEAMEVTQHGTTWVFGKPHQVGPGTALAAQLMKAKAIWNHDAFFDYYDRWMSKEDAYAAQRGNFTRPVQEGESLDPFVNAMWDAYRNAVPEQLGAKDNRIWIWKQDGSGMFVAHPNNPR